MGDTNEKQGSIIGNTGRQPSGHRCDHPDDLLQTSGVVILVHGLCMNDRQWLSREHYHGQALAGDLGVVPVYLRYNTGLHVSENGRQLARFLETLADGLSASTEIAIVAHSMGGLVSRSACHYAALSGCRWLDRLQKMIFLGTPHHGAPLEKTGHWLESAIKLSRYSAPLARLGQLRSSGVTDLRYGYAVDEDWNDRDRFERLPDQRQAVLLPERVACYAVAGVIGEEENIVNDRLVGDGLVTVASALGDHQDLSLNIPESRRWVVRNVNHMALLNHSGVYAKIRQWLEET